MDSISVNDIPQDWQALLGNYFETPEWENLKANLQKEFNLHLSLIRPEPENFFKALTTHPPHFRIAEFTPIIITST